jgi:xylan 1,4-beta-xylosidase
VEVHEPTQICLTVLGPAARPLKRIWAGVGYDEINWTYSTRGRRLLTQLGREVLSAGPFFVRCHNAFTSGNGLSWPAWGSGDPCHRRADGSLAFEWGLLDRIYDTIVTAGGLPLIELGFMPRVLSAMTADEKTWNRSDTEPDRDPYEVIGFAMPPKDFDEWGVLVEAFLSHLVDRYGLQVVATWFFELWNEPNLKDYWRGSTDDYLRLWDVTTTAFENVSPNLRLGGPGTAEIDSTEFMEAFCRHVSHPGAFRPSFLSFHTKGAYYKPRAHHDRLSAPSRQSPSIDVMMADVARNVEAIRRFPQFADTAILVDECDPAVGTIFGIHDNPSFVVTNSEYYASFVVTLIRRLADVQDVDGVVHWAFYMEGKRWFEGNRTLVDNDDVPKPILHALTLLDRLHCGERVDVAGETTDVRALAVRDGATTRVLVVRHRDPWWDTESSQRVQITVGSRHARGMVWRVDADHANGFRTWQRLGSADWPSAADARLIAEAAALHGGPVDLATSTNGTTVSLEIPLHSVTLVELT